MSSGPEPSVPWAPDRLDEMAARVVSEATKAAERVAERLFREPLSRPVAEVVEEGQGTDVVALVVVQRTGGNANRELAAVLAGDPRLELLGEAVAPPAFALVEGGPGAGVEEIHEPGSTHLVRAPSEHLGQPAD